MSYLRNYCLIQGQRFTSRFSTKNFILLALTFGYLKVAIELIFV